jgi:YesN/AraC family two-component response regulator
MFDERLPTVLIVDDEAAVRDWLKLSLALRGWVATTASSGEEALALAADPEPDLIILDHEMPGMTGIDCARKLRRQGMTGCIVLFSAFIDAKRTSMAQKLDVQPISKVDQQVLFRTIDALYEKLVEAVAAPT